MNNFSKLSDIYTNSVLLNEAKKTDTKEIKNVKKGNVVTKKMDIGNGKDKKIVGDGPDKAKLPQTANKKTKTKSMESYNSFEKLFKATLLENEVGLASPNAMNFEVPTTSDEMVDEIGTTEDEVATLASDLKDVVSKLNDILSKIEGESEEGESEEGESEEGETEEGESEEGESGEGVKESVEDHGHALVNAKSGKDFNTKKKYVVKGAVNVKGGKAQNGSYKEEPAPKTFSPSDKELRNTKNQTVRTSNIKTGDFFK